MRFAYADPPYLGCGKRHYGKHHPEAAIWDKIETHHHLIKRLCDEYPDGWAMSLSPQSLRAILPVCPQDCRIGIYVKTFAQISPVRVQWFWEPVIWRGGRKEPDKEHHRDWCQAWPRNGAQDGLIGGKPRDFCFWIFGLLSAQKGDQLDDLFPGTGAVSAAWAEYIRDQSRMPKLPLEQIAAQ